MGKMTTLEICIAYGPSDYVYMGMIEYMLMYINTVRTI